MFIGYHQTAVPHLDDHQVVPIRLLQDIFAEEQPVTFLFIPYANTAIHKRIKGIEPAPLGLDYNFIKWYVPEGQRRYKKSVALSP